MTQTVPSGFTHEDEIRLLRRAGYAVRTLHEWKCIASNFGMLTELLDCVRASAKEPLADDDIFVALCTVRVIHVSRHRVGSAAEFLGVDMPASFREIASLRNAHLPDLPEYVGFGHTAAFRQRYHGPASDAPAQQLGLFDDAA
ncbi:MAG: hypothetical protein M3Y27_12210 [Acidobacteriota bacterium]|nr:hypothetical protein [Acidobacteriota bacterium]